MNITMCNLTGILVIEPTVLGDSRGYFMETWNRERYHQAGLRMEFVQDNISLSRRGTLRGLHYQNPNPQGKLLQVLQGEVFDVAVDIRRSSITFGQWHGVLLSAENKKQFFIPPGFAHGFLVLSDTALFHYKCTDFYSPKDETTLSWDDPEVGIQWPTRDVLLSDKDKRGLKLRDIPTEKLFP